VRERLRKTAIDGVALEPGFEACDLFLVRGAIDDEIAHHGQIAQRLDRHLRLDCFPAGEHLAAVHAHSARAAHFRAAEPAVGKVGCLVLGDPVKRIEYAHPFLVRHGKLLSMGLASGSVGAGDPYGDRLAGHQSGVAQGKRVSMLDLAEAARRRERCAFERHYHAT
jgi:hypothetical protein